jgi:hypothetical protein
MRRKLRDLETKKWKKKAKRRMTTKDRGRTGATSAARPEACSAVKDALMSLTGLVLA